MTGTTVTVWLFGFWGVESASSGELSMQMTDQNGDVIASSPPLTVAWGGDSFLLSTTFTIPQGVTTVCRQASLQIAGTTLSAAPPDQRCIPVRP